MVDCLSSIALYFTIDSSGTVKTTATTSGFLAGLDDYYPGFDLGVIVTDPEGATDEICFGVCPVVGDGLGNGQGRAAFCFVGAHRGRYFTLNLSQRERGLCNRLGNSLRFRYGPRSHGILRKVELPPEIVSYFAL